MPILACFTSLHRTKRVLAREENERDSLFTTTVPLAVARTVVHEVALVNIHGFISMVNCLRNCFQAEAIITQGLHTPLMSSF